MAVEEGKKSASIAIHYLAGTSSYRKQRQQGGGVVGGAGVRWTRVL